MPTPSIQVIICDKEQTTMLAAGLLDLDFYSKGTQQHSLVIASATDVPVEMVHDVMKYRPDLCSSHQEADVLIARHVIATSILNISVRFVCDDTDVFVLLIHHYNEMCMNRASFIMSSPIREQAVVDIRPHGCKAP